MALEDTVIRLALEMDGWAYGDPLTRDSYLWVCYPGDTPRDAAALGRQQSTCLLFLRGLLARQRNEGGYELDGVVGGIDRLRAPYVQRIGLVEGDLRALAKTRGWLTEGAWGGDTMPTLPAGSMLVIGNLGEPPKDPVERARWQATWGGVAHGLLVTGRSGHQVESMDGGQTDPRNAHRPTSIRYRTRVLERRGNGWWLVSPSGDARRLNYVMWPTAA